ncbi:hypothetical protein BDK51DRAFT_32114 [Blyttiomyces helicus]|uniref:ABC-2 type transporter transmembrane domain-containing protein n=1 Tax=Blyttiomyces helicus TaxID=388810 RepID=A0A4P9W0Y8_9FUNG|nr:hypothetical protein BDK51DRAFT_32114 [Blyttiomyces helicus]|eukprot:RKO85831.1 hypothetical protein BDK51DRAFT_32114 [Blyttiomyces helicus]
MPSRPLPSDSEPPRDDRPAPLVALRQLGKSYQGRALARKALSFQRRQWFTNICCIALCPIMMVIISSVLGTVITHLIQGDQGIRNIVYCSNTPVVDSTGFPILNGTDLRLPSSTAIPSNIGKVTYLLNFMFYMFISSTENPGAATFGDTNPCVMWFGENYSSSPIAVRPNTTVQVFASTANEDSTYFSGPSTGYLQTISSPPANLVNAYDIADDAEVQSQYQLRPWAIVAASAAASPQLGSAPQKPLFNLTAIPAIFSSPLGFNPTNGSALANGLFDTIEPRLWYSIDKTTDSLLGMQQVPFFETASNLSTADDINAEMGNILRQTILALSKINKSALAQVNPAPSVLTAFFDSVAEATNGLPYAGLTFQTVDHSNRTYQVNILYARSDMPRAVINTQISHIHLTDAKSFTKYPMQIGSDIRLTRGANYRAPGKRMVLFQAMLGSALLRSSKPAKLGTATITQGVRLMPDISTTAIKLVLFRPANQERLRGPDVRTFPFSGLIGRVLFPFGVSFLMPVFVIMLVKEKEERILVMMQMHGMKSSTYYVSQYITLFLLYLLSAIVFLVFVFGHLAKISMFVNTQGAVLIILFLLWGNVQVGGCRMQGGGGGESDRSEFVAEYQRGERAKIEQYLDDPLPLCTTPKNTAPAGSRPLA